MTLIHRFIALVLVIPGLLSGQLDAAEAASAFYLGNEAVMVSRGETKIVFDPMYRNAYGHYETGSGQYRAQIDQR